MMVTPSVIEKSKGQFRTCLPSSYQTTSEAKSLDCVPMIQAISMRALSKIAKYLGGLVCTFGGIYLGNAYGAAYWRFGPFDLAWDTLFRGSVLVFIGFLLIRFGK